MKLFNEMGQTGGPRNTVTYSATTSACGKGAQWHRALKLFDEMGQAGVPRNTVTYNELAFRAVPSRTVPPSVRAEKARNGIVH